MPLIKSAIKKVRKDKTRTARNAKRENELKKTVKAALKNPTQKALDLAFSRLDKSVKVHVLHANTAARTKARLSRHLAAK